MSGASIRTDSLLSASVFESSPSVAKLVDNTAHQLTIGLLALFTGVLPKCLDCHWAGPQS